MREVTDSAGAFLLAGAMLRALEDVPADSAMAGTASRTVSRSAAARLMILLILMSLFLCSK